jgi:hypothetical protein
MTGLIPVSARPNFLSVAAATHCLPEGLTIAEIVAAWPEPLPDTWEAFGVVCVNGEPVPRDWWPHVRPRLVEGRPLAVSLHVLPQGGNAGKTVKNIGQIIGSIALIAATAWIGNGNIPGLSSFGSKLLASVIGLAGSLALKAMAPPPPRNGGDGLRQTAQAGAQINVLAPGAPLPTVLGTLRVSPPGLVPPYTSLNGQDLYTHAIVGMAGRHAVSSIKINNVPIDQFKGITYEVRTGKSTDGPLTLNNESIVQQSIGQKLSQFKLKDGKYIDGDVLGVDNGFPDWHSFRMRGSGLIFKIRLYWPSGLIYSDGDGKQHWVSQFIRAQCRKVGTTSWKTLPTAIVKAKITREFRVELIFDFNNGSSTTPKDFYGDETLKTMVIGETKNYPNTPTIRNDYPNYTVDSYWLDTGYWKNSADGQRLVGYNENYRDTITYYMNGTGGSGPGEYELRIKFGLPVPDTNANSDDLKSYRTFVAERDATDWHVVDDVMKKAIVNDAYIETATTEDFVNYPLGATNGLTLISVKVRNTVINSISAIFSKECNVYSGGNWNSIAATSNPAELFRHVALDNLNGEPLPSGLLDLANLQTWRSDCLSQGLTCNAIIEGRSVEQTLQLIAAAGHAAVRRSETWGVIMEKQRVASPIVQVFSPRNTANITIEKDYPVLPHGLRVSYIDAGDDYRPKETIVYDDGYSAGNATAIEAMDYDGKTNLAEVKKRARLDLRQHRLRTVRYSFDIDQAFMVCQRGDLVSFTYDVLDRRSDAAWIKSVVTQDPANLILGLVLDATVNLSFPATAEPWANDTLWSEADAWSASSKPGIVIQRRNGTVSSHQIRETTATNHVTLVTPQAWSAADVVGAQVIAGVLGSTTRRCIVFDIQPKDDFTARLTLVDEAPQITS